MTINNNYKEFNEVTDLNYINYCKRKNYSKLKAILTLIFGFINGPFNNIWDKIYSKLTRDKNAVKNYVDIRNINEASETLHKYLIGKSMSVDLLIQKLKK